MNNWSRRSDLNRGPADYESAALPLSYAGFTYDLKDLQNRLIIKIASLSTIFPLF